jgi:hypothetical protein
VVTKNDANLADPSRVTDYNSECPIFGVRTSLRVDEVVVTDDGNTIHTHCNGKARAISSARRTLILQRSPTRPVFRKETRPSG